jgi:hypothetical protein
MFSIGGLRFFLLLLCFACAAPHWNPDSNLRQSSGQRRAAASCALAFQSGIFPCALSHLVSSAGVVARASAQEDPQPSRDFRSGAALTTTDILYATNAVAVFTNSLMGCDSTCTPIVQMGSYTGLATVVCNSPLQGISFDGDDAGSLLVNFYTIAGCAIGSDGVTTTNRVSVISGSMFTFTDVTSTGPVRLVASSEVTGSTLLIQSGCIFKAACNPTASAAPTIAGFGFAALAVTNAAVIVDNSTVGCGSMTVTVPAGWVNGAGVGILGVAAGNGIAAIATVAITNCLIFGPGSATATAIMGAPTSPAVITQLDEGVFVYGVGIAYRNGGLLDAQATVAFNRSTLHAGTATYTATPAARGVGALGVGQWIRQSTNARVVVIDSTIVVDAISFGTSTVSLYIGGAGVMALYSWDGLGTSYDTAVTRSNVTVGPVTCGGSIFSVYAAAGVVAYATPDLVPGLSIQAAMINSTLLAGRITANTRGAMANFVINGFGVVDVIHPAQRIATWVANSVVTAGPVTAGDYGYAMLAGVGAMLHINVTTPVVVVSVTNSSVRAATIGLRDERYQAPEPRYATYTVAGIGLVTYALVRVSEALVNVSDTRVFVDGPLHTPICTAIVAYTIRGIGYTGDANASFISVVADKVAVVISDADIAAAAAPSDCDYNTNYTSGCVYGVGVAANWVRNSADPIATTVITTTRSTIAVHGVFHIRIFFCVLGVGFTWAQWPRAAAVQVNVASTSVAVSSAGWSYTYMDYNVIGIGATWVAIWSEGCTYDVAATDSNVTIDDFTAVVSSFNAFGIGTIGQPGLPGFYTPRDRASGVSICATRCIVVIQNFMSGAAALQLAVVGIGSSLATYYNATNVTVIAAESTIVVKNVTAVSSTGVALGVGAQLWSLPVSGVTVTAAATLVRISNVTWGSALVVVTGAGIGMYNGMMANLSIAVTQGSNVTVSNVTALDMCRGCIGAVGLSVWGAPGGATWLDNSSVVVDGGSRIEVVGFTVLTSDPRSAVIGAVGIAVANVTTHAFGTNVVRVLQSQVSVRSLYGVFNALVLGVGFSAWLMTTLGGSHVVMLGEAANISVCDCNVAVAGGIIGVAGHAFGVESPSVVIESGALIVVMSSGNVTLAARGIRIDRALLSDLGMSVTTVSGAAVAGVGVAGGLVARGATAAVRVVVTQTALTVRDVNVSAALAAVVGGLGAAWWRDDAVLSLAVAAANETSGTTTVTLGAAAHVVVDVLSILAPDPSAPAGESECGPMVVGAAGVANAWWWTPSGSSAVRAPTSNTFVATVSADNATVTAALRLVRAAGSDNNKSVVAGYVGGIGVATRGLSVAFQSSVAIQGPCAIVSTVRWCEATSPSGAVADDFATARDAPRFSVPGVITAGFVVVVRGDGTDGVGNGNFRNSSLAVSGAAVLRGAVAPALGRTAGPDAAVAGVVVPAAAGWASGAVTTDSGAAFECGTGPCVRLPLLGGAAAAAANRSIAVALTSSTFAACAAAPWAGVIVATDDGAYRPLLTNVTAALWNPQHPATVPLAALSGGNTFRPCDGAAVSAATATASASDLRSLSQSVSGNSASHSGPSASAGTARSSASATDGTATGTRTRRTTGGGGGTRSGGTQPSTLSVSPGTAATSASATATATASESIVPPRAVTETERSGVVVSGTWLGLVAQFAVSGLGPPLGALRATGLSMSLRRIGSANGCRGQDAAAPPEFLTSPLQLGMAGGRDYITGTAVGAPIVVAAAAVAGAVVGAAVHALHALAWAPLQAWVARRLATPSARPSDNTRRTDLRHRAQRSTADDSQVELPIQLAAAAAGGAAQFMIAASAIVSQPAVAAAVLRSAEGPVDGTPSWYPAAAVVCALVSFIPPMVAVWLAWPRRWPSGFPAEAAPHRVVYACFHNAADAATAAAFRPNGLRAASRRYLGDDGRWVVVPQLRPPVPGTPSTIVLQSSGAAVHNPSVVPQLLPSERDAEFSMTGNRSNFDPFAPPPPRAVSPFVPCGDFTADPFALPSAPVCRTASMAANVPPLEVNGSSLLLPALVAQPESVRPAAAAQRPPSALLLGGDFALNVGGEGESGRATTAAAVRPWGVSRGIATVRPADASLQSGSAAAVTPLRRPVLPLAAAATNRPNPCGSGQAALAAGAAWGEALYGEYRGHARLAAQFVVASQALQGLAQAAGELTPRGLVAGPDLGAWASCVAATVAQLVVMGLCSAVLLWAQPHRARRNLDAETVPTVLQAGICAPIALLAARHWPPTATIAAWLDAALGASALLQPVLGVLLALHEAASEVDFATVAAVLRARRAAGPQ